MAWLLQKARETDDDLEARLLLAAAVEQVALGVGIQPVVTGGTAVDFYAAEAAGTSESYPPGWRASADVDLVVLSVAGGPGTRKLLIEALADYGLKPVNPDVPRTIEVPDFGYGLEIVGDELNLDPKAERIVTVRIDGKYPVTFRGPEDLILTYGEWAWVEFSPRDWERALAVYRTMRERIDMQYLVEAAKARGKEEMLRAITEQRPLLPRK